MLSVAAELRAEAARQHIGVTGLAELAGMPHSTVSKSLNGKRMIDVEELGKLCAALMVEPAEIFRRAEEVALRSRSNVTELRPSVGGARDDDDHQEDEYEGPRAAGSDRSQGSPDEVEP